MKSTFIIVAFLFSSPVLLRVHWDCCNNIQWMFPKVCNRDVYKRQQSAFRTLNEEWITDYFRMEEADYKALDHPKEYILDKGGAILVALYKDEPVGVPMKKVARTL